MVALSSNSGLTRIDYDGNHKYVLSGSFSKLCGLQQGKILILWSDVLFLLFHLHAEDPLCQPYVVYQIILYRVPSDRSTLYTSGCNSNELPVPPVCLPVIIRTVWPEQLSEQIRLIKVETSNLLASNKPDDCKVQREISDHVDERDR